MSEPQYVSLDDVQKLVDAQLAKVRQEHDDAMAAQKSETDSLRAALEAAQRAGTPSTNVVEHGAGPGLEIAETWSQAQQTASRADADAARTRAA